MGETYIDAQVARVNRNLMLVNGGILGLILLFLAFMVIGGLALARFHSQTVAFGEAHNPNVIRNQPAALDISHPAPIGIADIASPDRLAQLEGHTVTFTDPQVQNLMFPVWDWMTRATGKTKPHAPPMYHVSLANGRPFLILPATQTPGKTFTGVIRPLTAADSNPARAVLMGHGLPEALPFILDCLNLEGSPASAHPMPVAPTPNVSLVPYNPTSLLVFVLVVGLSGWNIFKAAYRMKNPLTHPIYTKLARYGSPLRVVPAIESDRQAGVTVIHPLEFTRSWLFFPTFWTLDAVPLDQVAWAYKMVTSVNLIPTFFRMIIVDRDGKSHPISTSDGQIANLLEHLSQVCPGIFLGYNRDLRNRFFGDRAAVLAEIDSRRSRNI